jgi:hypothetical protein
VCSWFSRRPLTRRLLPSFTAIAFQWRPPHLQSTVVPPVRPHRPPSQKLQSLLATPSSPKHSGASPGKATTMAAWLPPSSVTSSCGPTSLVGASPRALSAAALGFPPLVPNLSFKEVASCQWSLFGLHASLLRVASLQGHPSGLHAVVPEALTVSIPMPQEALTHARHYNRHALVCRFNGFWPSLPDLISWFSSEWYLFLDREVIPCPFAKGFFVVVFYSTSDRDKVFNSEAMVLG